MTTRTAASSRGIAARSPMSTPQPSSDDLRAQPALTETTSFGQPAAPAPQAASVWSRPTEADVAPDWNSFSPPAIAAVAPVARVEAPRQDAPVWSHPLTPTTQTPVMPAPPAPPYPQFTTFGQLQQSAPTAVRETETRTTHRSSRGRGAAGFLAIGLLSATLASGGTVVALQSAGLLDHTATAPNLTSQPIAAVPAAAVPSSSTASP